MLILETYCGLGVNTVSIVLGVSHPIECPTAMPDAKSEIQLHCIYRTALFRLQKYESLPAVGRTRTSNHHVEYDLFDTTPLSIAIVVVRIEDIIVSLE